MFKKVLKYKVCIILAIGIILTIGIKVVRERSGASLGADMELGSSMRGGSWVSINSFGGYKTEVDASKLQTGESPNGQNTTTNDGDRISIRNFGYEIFGATSSTAEKIGSLHTFRKRDGGNIFMRASGSLLEYYNKLNSQFEILGTGYTTSSFGFADNNINTDLSSYVYFGNSEQDFSRWNGAYSLTNGAISSGDGTVVVDDTSNFTATGSIILCGFSEGYTSKNATTFTLTNTADSDCANNRGVAQAVETYSNNPKGNIYLLANNRLFISGVASSTQAIFFSEYADATSFDVPIVSDSTNASAGIFNLGEGGGGVISMIQDEGALYFFKKSIIYKATLTDTLYTLSALKPFDGKSQTIGATASKSTFTGGNAVFFISPDKQIFMLRRVEQVDYPQVIPISKPIQPTVNSLDFSLSSGIVYKDKAYFSAKSDSTIGFNDTLLIYDIKNNKWDTPAVGLLVSDLLVYDDGSGEELYFGDNTVSQTYKRIDDTIDNSLGLSANWRSKQYTFGLPHKQKRMSDVYIEGYISQSSTLTISLLLDEDGYTEQFSTTIAGTDTDYIFNSQSYNTFGLSRFGTERFGSNDDLSGKKKFRVYLGKTFRPNDFYTAQLDFSSDGENEQWEITNYAFLVGEATEPLDRNLYKAFQ